MKIGIENPLSLSPEDLGQRVLDRDFFDRRTKEVARGLLGKILVRKIGDKIIAGKIVEVEAYIGEHDPAAHVSAGRTGRTEVLYDEPGNAYIFKIRGHHCLNAVAEEENSPGCVLIRAIEPILGINEMKNMSAPPIPKSGFLPGKSPINFFIREAPQPTKARPAPV